MVLDEALTYQRSFFLKTLGSAPRWGQSHRRLILLRSVGWVPPDWDPSTRLPRSRDEDRPEPPLNVVEGYAENRGRTPTPTRDGVDDLAQTVRGTSLAIAHMNAISSRAMAVTATFGCLPRAVRRRKRLHSRTWAFQPMS
jgi:hypothetical protein